MPDPDSSGKVRCKLCAAFAASGLPTAAERGLVGSESFTRDPEICDACLNQDYSTRCRRISTELSFALSLGLFIAVIAASLITVSQRHAVLKHFVALQPLARMLTTFLIVAVVVAIPCILASWLAIHVLFRFGRIRVRAVIKKELDEGASIDGARFFWLARWASLTGHEKFGRRMFKQAAALGVGDLRGASGAA